jgi:hypothetical protein
VHENKWQALVIRANEVSAFDLDDIDDEGRLSSSRTRMIKRTPSRHLAARD